MRLGGFQRALMPWLSGSCALVFACAFAGAFTLLVAIPLPATAQTTAPTTPEPVVDIVPPVAINPFAAGVVVDFREHMRTFVQSISTYARSINPRFMVIAKDGLSLVGKPDPADDTVIFPARAYMHAIDGVMETRLLDETITTPAGKPDPELEAVVKRRGADFAMARAGGLNVFGLEYASEPKAVDALYAALSNKGTIPFVGESPELATIPAHPVTAYNANAKPIAAAAEVQNYLFIANAKGFGTTPDFIQAVRSTNHDIVIIDVFQGRAPLTRQDVTWMKYKKLGAPRLVLAEIDISTAAPFDYYWKPGWGKGNPPFIFAPVRNDPDRFRTIYWDPGWQAIISGDFNSYVYGLVDLGFDGVVLKGIDAWRFYEAGGDVQ